MNTSTPLLSRLPLRGSLVALAAALPLSFLAATSAQAAVMISQIYGGGGNGGATYTHDYVELHNNGSAAVNLSGYTLQYAATAGTTWTNNTALTGSIPAGGYFLIRLATGGAVGAALPVTPDVLGTTNMSATNGKVALVSNATALTGSCPLGGAIVDFVGFGSANCFEGAAAPTPSATLAITRANATATTCQDTDNNASDFATNAPGPRNSASAAQACRIGGVTPGPATARAIFEIQGSTGTSPHAGTTVVTRGVVTKVNSNGFFIQDLNGDGNPNTSDGLFVFTGSTVHAAAVVGNLVDVTGTVVEFNVGSSADTAAHTVTEISPATTVAFVGNGYTIQPTVITLPEAVNDDLEKLEGMLVTINSPLTVNQNFFMSRYGQLTLAAGGRLETPSNRYRPGTPQIAALMDENNRRRILLDDGSSLQNPNPIPYIGAGVRRAGDVLATLTGVVDYGLATNSAAGAGDYKIHPTVTPVFTPGNLRTTAPDAVGGNLKVASFNVLNYFTTFTNGATADGQTGQGCTLGSSTTAGNCRGADNITEFLRQQTKIVKAMAALDADVLGLMEIQNNGNTAAQNLVNALNAEVGAGTYATTALPADTGTDAIRLAMIYKPAKLSTVGASVSDNDAINNRPTLAQTFAMPNGERFTLFVNHLKSKGSCPAVSDADYAGNFDAGDGQGCWNLLRKQQATRLRAFVAQRAAAVGSTDALLIGDMNAYGQEDPIFELTSNGFVDQAGRFSTMAYSYVFDGAAGRLDHALASTSLSAKVNRAAHWHINADEPTAIDYNTEFKAPASTCGVGGVSACPADPYTASPYRASDHDAVVIGLNLYGRITVGTAIGEAINGTAIDDLLIGGVGSDVLSGGAGSNGFSYLSMRDAGDTITDFIPGKDRIDLSLLLAGLGIPSSVALSGGHVLLSPIGTDLQILIDTDGSAGPVRARTLLTLRSVSASAIDPARDLGLSAGPAAARGASLRVRR